MAAKRVRVKPWEAAVAVSHPQTGQFVVPNRSQYYRSDDQLVQAHSWLFAGDDEIAEYYDEQDSEPAEPANRRARR